VDYGQLVDQPVAEVRAQLGVPAKSPGALSGGSAGAFDREGMSAMQQRYADEREATRR
jgi:hypothetical protein